MGEDEIPTPTVRRARPAEPDNGLEPFEDFAQAMDAKVRGLRGTGSEGKGYSVNPDALKQKLRAMRTKFKKKD